MVVEDTTKAESIENTYEENAYLTGIRLQSTVTELCFVWNESKNLVHVVQVCYYH